MTASAGSLSVSGSTITVSGLTLNQGQTLSIVYGDKGNGQGATAPATAAAQTWSTQTKGTVNGAFVAHRRRPWRWLRRFPRPTA